MNKKSDNKSSNLLHFIHITDTHLLNHAEDHFQGFNTKDTLEAILDDIHLHYPDIDFLLITGDVSQTGDKNSYAVLKNVIQKCKFRIFCVPGNHDTPRYLKNIIPNCPNNSVKVINFGNSSLVLLNSWVENKHHGLISQHCLEQLKNYLSNNIYECTIFALHHPPTIINSKWLDELMLLNKHELLKLINKYTQYSLVLFGHIHQAFDKQIDNVRFLSTPSTCYQFKPNSKNMQLVDMPSPAYRYIKLNHESHHSNVLHTKIHTINQPFKLDGL